MEYINDIAPYTPEIITPIEQPSEKHFITSNTISGNLQEMKDHHLIPVFSRDNEPTISHIDFIETVQEITADIYSGEHILKPVVRLSHPIKGRVPEAKHKSANELFEWEKTIYYERMAFVIEIPSIQAEIDGNILSLTVGGVKAYNLDNLYSKAQSDQHFKFFVGFKNKVCTNLCVWTDGYMGDVKVRNSNQLASLVNTLLQSYNSSHHLFHLEQLSKHSITEEQFAQLVGRCRMYPNLPAQKKADIPPILFGDQMMANVVRDYYRDESFCRDSQGNINLWKFFNLFTGANKSSYIDSFLYRSVNAFQLVEQIRNGLENRNECWFLN